MEGAITTLAEKGLPDWVIQAQVGHVAPEDEDFADERSRDALLPRKTATLERKLHALLPTVDARAA